MSAPSLAGRLAAARRSVLAGLVFALPLFFLWDVTYGAYATPKLALLVVATSVAAALRAGELILGAPVPRLGRVMAPAAFVAVPVAVAWAAGTYKGWSLLGAYERYEGLIPVLLVVAAGVLLADAFRDDFRVPAWALTASAGLVGLYTVVQSVGLDPLDVPIREFVPSTIGHSNFVGGFLGIALPVSLALWTSSPSRARVVAMATSILVVLGVLLSGSQGGWLATAAGLAVFTGGMLRARRPRAYPAGWCVAAGVAALGVGLVVLSLVDPFNPIVPDTVRARGLWWREAAAMGMDSPVWGHGPDTFAVEGTHYRNAEDALAHDKTYADEPHSVPLARFAAQGVVGLAGFLALLVWVVRWAFAAPPAPLSYAFAAGAAAYFTQSFSSIDALVLTVPLWVCIAALAAESPEDPGGAAARPPVGRTVLALGTVAVVAAAATWWSVRFLAVDARVNDAIETFTGGRTAEGLALLEDALDERDTEQYRHVYGSILGAAALRERAGGEDEIARMREVFSFVRDFPEVRALTSYGDALHQWSVYDPALEGEALEQFERVLSFDEYSPTVRVLMAEAFIRGGRGPEAVYLLEGMVPLMEELPQFSGVQPMLWGALSVAYSHNGQTDEARSALDRALEIGDDTSDVGECHVLVARELLRHDGAPATRDELRETSPGLVLCRPATLALLPGWDPEEAE